MANVASQLILHPTISQSLKVSATTVGRDKAYRTVQYFARFLAWYLISKGHKDQGARWNALKSHLGTARKLMRLGKPLEHLQAALRASQSAGVVGEQVTTIGRQLAYFGYLAYDAAVWANAVKFVKLDPATAARINSTSNRFWFAGILFSITHSLLKAGRLAHEFHKLRSPAWGEKDLSQQADREVKRRALETAQKATRHQIIIDLLDIWIPATNLGFVNINDGILGIFGTITSLMALQSQWYTVNSKK